MRTTPYDANGNTLTTKNTGKDLQFEFNSLNLLDNVKQNGAVKARYIWTADGAKRAVIEIINDELKNICQIEHSRHRRFLNFVVNLLSGLAAYCYFPKEPSIQIETEMSNQLTLF